MGKNSPTYGKYTVRSVLKNGEIKVRVYDYTTTRISTEVKRALAVFASRYQVSMLAVVDAAILQYIQQHEGVEDKALLQDKTPLQTEEGTQQA